MDNPVLFDIEPDPEYRARIDAERCTLQFRDALRPQSPQARMEELPLFGGFCQGSLLEDHKGGNR